MSSSTALPARGVSLIMFAALAACGAPEARPPAEERQAGLQGGHEEGAHEEGAHEEGEASDLDRPVEELFSATCEHGLRTYECDECRYEVGVARAPEELFSGGLVEAVKVERRRLEVPLRLTGEVQFDERRVAHVSAHVEGLIRALHVTLGDRVVRGQPLVEVESSDVGEARVSFFEAQGQLELARRTLARLEGLRREGIASEREYLEARRELEAAEIQAEGARATLGYLGAGGGASRAIARARVSLRAPLDGMVLQMHAVSGELAEVGESLLTVGDNSTLWVWADLYERDVAKVTRALRGAGGKLAATVSVEAFPGEELPGEVDFVSPAMDEASRTVKVRVEVPNPEGALLAGMFATVKVFLPTAEQVLTVPRDAVLEDGGRAFVFVRHQGDYFVRRPVLRGREEGGRVEIGGGPAEGATVLGRGAFLLKSDVLRSKMGAGCAD